MRFKRVVTTHKRPLNNTHPDMALIEKFTHQPAYLGFESSPFNSPASIEKQYGCPIKMIGGYNHAAGTLTPMRFNDSIGVFIYLDSLTGAVEAGLVDDRRWPKQLFASFDDLQGFCKALAKFDGVRFHDRWASAIALITSEHAQTLNTAKEFAKALWDDGAAVLKKTI